MKELMQKEGREEGRQKLRESARILKTNGVSPELISNATGFSLQEIEGL
ncbi:hypothetical protein FACS1894110_06310 [Spirochaetia bacterium]|nr:hypothetical protein FACS1894110_06310 [Spirochaetia bacterium]